MQHWEEVGKTMEMSWQCMLTAQTERHILGCIKRDMASWSREVTPTLYSVLMRSHLESLNLTDAGYAVSSHKQEWECSNKQPNSLRVPCKHSFA